MKGDDGAERVTTTATSDAVLVGASFGDVTHPLDCLVVGLLEDFEKTHMQTARGKHWNLAQIHTRSELLVRGEEEKRSRTWKSITIGGRLHGLSVCIVAIISTFAWRQWARHTINNRKVKARKEAVSWVCIKMNVCKLDSNALPPT